MIRCIVSEIIALLDNFGHLSVPGHSIAVGMEIFDQKKTSTCQAGSNEVSYVHIRAVVQEIFCLKGKNLCSFDIILDLANFDEPLGKELKELLSV